LSEAASRDRDDNALTIRCIVVPAEPLTPPSAKFGRPGARRPSCPCAGLPIQRPPGDAAPRENNDWRDAIVRCHRRVDLLRRSQMLARRDRQRRRMAGRCSPLRCRRPLRMFGLRSPRRRHQAGLGIQKVSEAWSRDRDKRALSIRCIVVRAEPLRPPARSSAGPARSTPRLIARRAAAAEAFQKVSAKYIRSIYPRVAVPV
jgi:hypothetical protein